MSYHNIELSFDKEQALNQFLSREILGIGKISHYIILAGSHGVNFFLKQGNDNLKYLFHQQETLLYEYLQINPWLFASLISKVANYYNQDNVPALVAHLFRDGMSSPYGSVAKPKEGVN